MYEKVIVIMTLINDGSLLPCLIDLLIVVVRAAPDPVGAVHPDRVPENGPRHRA